MGQHVSFEGKPVLRIELRGRKLDMACFAVELMRPARRHGCPIIRLHPLRADDRAVMVVAGGIDQLVALAFVAMVKPERLRVGLEPGSWREILVITRHAGNSYFVD